MAKETGEQVPIFPAFKDYMSRVMKMGKPIGWEFIFVKTRAQGPKAAGVSTLRSHTFRPKKDDLASGLHQKLAEQVFSENLDVLTCAVFGECGTGKSTFLSLISKIYTTHFCGANK